MRHLLLRGVDCVIAASPLELRDSLADPRAGVVIAHPVTDAAPTRRPAQQSSGDPFAIGFLGRLHPKKNVSHLLHALAALPGNSRLIICGAGRPEYERELVQIAATAGVTDRVVWRGFADFEEKRRLFAEVSVIAMPSAYESFGMVAAEAMAAGVPVIVSRSTGIAPIVERYGAGAVVSSDEPTEFARALMTFMNEPERLARAERGAIEAARDALCFDGYARAVSGVYDQVAARRQR
jgi:glycosyltransferase involved in cell wall biosynthesis